MEAVQNNFITTLTNKIKNVCQIEKSLFTRYDVKRGLRNQDHTGVLVGLTNIGDVVGYRKEEDKIIPIEGELYYRGYKITDLVEGFQKDGRQGYDEICYLLFTGELPDHDELKIFSEYLAEKRSLPQVFKKSILMTERNIPEQNLMNLLAREVLTLYTLDEKPEDRSEENVVRQIFELIAKYPAILAYSISAARHSFQNTTLSIRNPRADLTTAENFLYMLKGENFSQLEADLLDLAMVLHAEHGGGNNSTFTSRVISSAGTDTYSAISAAIGSLKGIYHGGANIKVMEMMDHLKENIEDWNDKQEIADYILKILKKEVFDGYGKIYGFGHAVYTLSDPRAKLLKQKAGELAVAKKREREFALYTNLEEIVPRVFTKYKGRGKILCANVDFYSGFVYSCLGLSREIFTPLFSMARLAGWCAHRLEEVNHSSKRIIRPAYKNVNTKKRYTPLSKRGMPEPKILPG
jgi:citrate synthase